MSNGINMQEIAGMRELTAAELDEVSGGFWAELWYAVSDSIDEICESLVPWIW